MTRNVVIDDKSRRMLELLAQGASNRLVARKMGYREGTMRVYLHNLYRKLGVSNKTEAVIWYLGRDRAKDGAAKGAAPAQEMRASNADILGEMALGEDLYTALGVMSWFVGPYGRVWEVGVRLNGVELDAAALQRRMRGRDLWRALLKGDFAHGKRLHDQDGGEALLRESPSDAVILAALLLIGGYATAANSLVSRLAGRRRGAAVISTREAALIEALPGSLDSHDDEAMAALGRLAAERAAPAVLRQVAIVSVFHAARARRDATRARKAAHALWGEAETARQQLHAMGERTLGIEAAKPAMARPVEGEAAPRRAKVTADR